MKDVTIGQRWVHRENGQIVEVLSIGRGLRPTVYVRRADDTPHGIPGMRWNTSRSGINLDFRPLPAPPEGISQKQSKVLDELNSGVIYGNKYVG